jgi:cellulose synthase/poly-beta-1,6-N-acetylglucosamine synthase-like glycosyltransferase
VSVIVSAYNEAAHIEEKLENCLALDYPPELLELIVVADGSDDGTEQVAGRTPGATVLHDEARRGKAAAMARGAAAASGEILVFSDANNLYTAETLTALVKPFADPRVGVVTGRKTIDDRSGRALDRSESLYWRYESRLKAWESQLGSVAGVVGEALAVRRTAFRPPDEGTVNDDFVIAMTAAIDGWRVQYAPDAVSMERASLTLEEESLRRARIVAGRWQALARLLPELMRRRPLLAWQVVSHKGLRPLVPYALAAAAVSSVSCAPRARWARIAVALQAAFYAAALAGWHDERRGRRRRLFYLPYYFCRVNAAAVIGLLRFLCGRERGVWDRVRRG